MPETIKLTEPAPGVAVVAFDRPEVANALSTRMGEELTEDTCELFALTGRNLIPEMTEHLRWAVQGRGGAGLCRCMRILLRVDVEPGTSVPDRSRA